jgi:hypothetical protein
MPSVPPEMSLEARKSKIRPRALSTDENESGSAVLENLI